ncbi:MAG: flagellar biosynthesis anti-sigma factor FlgM [Gemmataceae bacterium]|nr:flagellar biosynthesis anti-sigma factor FlgM [Gemmata sp.]MDW8198117.1 flagellar biosynthesis anti-sigma factor FlgM [Gemmataceae bacterium]
MRKTSPRHWYRWKLTLCSQPASPPTNRVHDRPSPSPEGIRHELVARIRQQIADGTYETEDKWRLAEEALLRRIEDTL